VRLLLESIELKYPSLLSNIDAAVLDWWREYFSRPRIGPLTIMVLAAAPLFVALVALVGQQPPTSAVIGFFVTLALIATGVAAKYVAFDLARHRWERDWAWRAPPWAQAGWSVLGVAAMLAAAALPPHPALTGLSAFLAVAVLVWTFAVAEADSDKELTTRFGIILFTNFAPAVAWLMMISAGYRPEAIWQASLPLVATGIAISRGPIMLLEGWHAIVPKKLGVAATLAAIAANAGVFALVVSVSGGGEAPPLILGVAAIALSFACRIPGLSATEGERKISYYAGLAATVGILVVGLGMEYSIAAVAALILTARSAVSLLVTAASQMQVRY
jgi:hypothetical protein